MEVTTTDFKGLLIIKPRVFGDDRGYFYESYNRQGFYSAGIEYSFIQDNQSESHKGVIRGLHYQLEPHAQTKLVRVLCGKIYDVVVDLRSESPMFGNWFGLELSAENKLQLLVPKGFAHGFSVLSDKAIVLYKTDDFYSRESERGIVYNDPILGIDWQTGAGQETVSEKDKVLPRFADADYSFQF